VGCFYDSSNEFWPSDYQGSQDKVNGYITSAENDGATIGG